MATTEKVCIVGAYGMLGRELVEACQQAPGRQSIECLPLDLEEIDITDARRVADVIAQLRPNLVINAAGYTDVDGCDSHQALAAAANANGPAYLAHACRAHRCRLIHVSSDYVFDGRKSEAYLPDDPVHPLNVYGRSKADGERLVREAQCSYVIVRSSWLFGRYGKNFVKTMLALFQERDELSVVTDQVGCPTYARDLALALLAVGQSDFVGTCQFCNAGACSWHEFAVEIARQAGVRVKVLPITSEQLNRPAKRPAYSVLSTKSFTKHTGMTPRPWQEALAQCLQELGSIGECNKDR